MAPSTTEGPVEDSGSELSSPLTIWSRSPSPPSFFTAESSYPTPPSSQNSTASSPSPDSNSEAMEGHRPAKRRRTDKRDTFNLNLDELDSSTTPESNEDLDRLVKAIKSYNKIVVIAGAGISVSAGVPDFRSSQGLFKTLRKEHKLKGSGKNLFDAGVYRDDTSTENFHQMVRSLAQLSTNAKPTPFHHLIARLAQEGRLLRLYTQNVDGIDTSMEPLRTQIPLPSKGPWPKAIQLHGTLEKMECTKCKTITDFDASLLEGADPASCQNCVDIDNTRTVIAGKRSHGIGRLRPRMVLYNEHGPDDEAIGRATAADLKKRPDCVIVVGTTLKVPGVRRIAREMCKVVRDRRDGLAVWINKDPAPPGIDLENCWDLVVKGPCDLVAEHVNLGRWDDPVLYDSPQFVTREDTEQAQKRSCFSLVLKTGAEDVEPPPTSPITPLSRSSLRVDDSPIVLPSLKAEKTLVERMKPTKAQIDEVLKQLQLMPRPSQSEQVQQPQKCLNTSFIGSREPQQYSESLSGRGKLLEVIPKEGILEGKKKPNRQPRKDKGVKRGPRKSSNQAITNLLPTTKQLQVTAIPTEKQPLSNMKAAFNSENHLAEAFETGLKSPKKDPIFSPVAACEIRTNSAPTITQVADRTVENP